ncbi:hypothetical protein KCP77_06885 [Salmonella enterica subsp. enterica]|nr:hypothetical protein KCP77_06885 [Salmonella enterica subsp. enterica]
MRAQKSRNGVQAGFDWTTGRVVDTSMKIGRGDVRGAARRLLIELTGRGNGRFALCHGQHGACLGTAGSLCKKRTIYKFERRFREVELVLCRSSQGTRK